MFSTVTPKNPTTYCIGIDAGIRGIGLAALELDDAGFVIRILAATTIRIDGGMMPGTAKSPVSRLAKAGQARRVRRLTRRKTARLKKLDQILASHGYPVIDEAHTYEPWEAREKLVTQLIHDEDELRRLVSIALRHIARHRGWRNPWLSESTFYNLPTPSANHRRNLELAQDRFDRNLEGFTVGQLGHLGTRKTIQIRPRTADKGLHQSTGADPLFKEQILQEDHVAEIRKIWEVQNLPDEHLDILLESVFYQNSPSVPLERVGKDVLPGAADRYRALRASLEFQEYRVRAVIGNLRINDKNRKTKRPLNPEEYRNVYDLLSQWHANDDIAAGVFPTWADVADALGIEAPHLQGRDSEESAASRPPTMRSLSDLEARISNLKPAAIRKQVRTWYDGADLDQISALISWLADATDASDELLEQSGLADIIADWDDTA